MIIGLWDADFTTFRQPIFNLELMKLASYYKQQNHIVTLSPKLEPDRFTKFIVRKDWDDGKYPKEFFRENVTYGGRAFAEQYIPLDKEIELSRPDTHIYDTFARVYSFNLYKMPEFGIMQHALHSRASYDGKTLSDSFLNSLNWIYSRNKSFIFHDYDLGKTECGLKAAHMVTEQKTSKIPIYIGAKFPISIYNDDQMYQWLQLKTLKSFFTLELHYIMSDDTFRVFLQKSFNKCDNIECIVTSSCSDENDFMINKLPIFYKQALISSNRGKRFLLKYDSEFFKDKRYERVIDFINFFNHGHAVTYLDSRKNTKEITLYQYVKNWQTRWENYCKDQRLIFTFEEIREIFTFVREKNYEVFKMFYEYTGDDFV